MVSKKIQKALEGNSAIRAMFVEGMEMAEKYGAENVYDFSLGNPDLPAPKEVVDGQKVTDVNASVSAGQLSGNGVMIKKGKKVFRKFTV